MYIFIPKQRNITSQFYENFTTENKRNLKKNQKQSKIQKGLGFERHSIKVNICIYVYLNRKI